MLIPPWAWLDKWTVGQTTTRLQRRLLFANTRCVTAEEQLSLQRQSNRCLIWTEAQRSDRKRTTSQFVCLQISLSHLEQTDYPSRAAGAEPSQRGLVWLDFSGDTFRRQSVLLVFPPGKRPHWRQRPAECAATVGCRRPWGWRGGGMWAETVPVSVCLQWWQDVAWKLCNVCFNFIIELQIINPTQWAHMHHRRAFVYLRKLYIPWTGFLLSEGTSQGKIRLFFFFSTFGV